MPDKIEMTIGEEIQADKTNDIIEFPVDERFIDQAEQEAFAIILQQKSDFENRWNQRFKLTKHRKGLMRKVILSLGGLLMSASFICYFAFQDPDFLWLFAICLALFLASVFQNKIEKIMRKKSINQSKNWAQACMGTSRQSAPFLASYRINNKNISYYRCKAGNKSYQWSRELKGVAVQGKAVTLFFKNKSTLLPPTMVLLHNNPTDFCEIFTKLGVTCFDTSKEINRT